MLLHFLFVDVVGVESVFRVDLVGLFLGLLVRGLHLLPIVRARAEGLLVLLLCELIARR